MSTSNGRTSGRSWLSLTVAAATFAAATVWPPAVVAAAVEFTLSLSPGPNLVSLPLRPISGDSGPYRASLLAEHTGAAFVAKLERQAGGRLEAVPYILGLQTADAPIDGGAVFLVQAPASRNVVFEGVAWPERPSLELERGLTPFGPVRELPSEMSVNGLVGLLRASAAIASFAPPGERSGFQVVLPTGARDLPLRRGMGLLLVSNAPTTPATLPYGNRPAVAVTGGDRSGQSTGLLVLTADRSYDPDGDPLTCEWRQLEGPSQGITGSATAGPFLPVHVTQPGTYRFELSVTDGKSPSNEATLTVTGFPPELGGGERLTQRVNADSGATLVNGLARVFLPARVLARDASVTLVTTPVPAPDAGIPRCRGGCSLLVSLDIPPEAVPDSGQAIQNPMAVDLELPDGYDVLNSAVEIRQQWHVGATTFPVSYYGSIEPVVPPRLFRTYCPVATHTLLRYRQMNASPTEASGPDLNPLDSQPLGARTPVILLHGSFGLEATDVTTGEVADFKAGTFDAFRGMRLGVAGERADFNPNSDADRIAMGADFAALLQNYKFYLFRYRTTGRFPGPGYTPTSWLRGAGQQLVELVASSELDDPAQLAARNGRTIRDLVLVGYSTGGLVSRFAMDCTTTVDGEKFGARVAALLAVATPHRGSLVRSLARAACCMALATGSADGGCPKPYSFGPSFLVKAAAGFENPPGTGVEDLGYEYTASRVEPLHGIVPNHVLASFNHEDPFATSRVYALAGGLEDGGQALIGAAAAVVDTYRNLGYQPCSNAELPMVFDLLALYPQNPDLGTEISRRMAGYFDCDRLDNDGVVTFDSATAQGLLLASETDAPDAFLGTRAGGFEDRLAVFRGADHRTMMFRRDVVSALHGFLARRRPPDTSQPPAISTTAGLEAARIGVPYNVALQAVSTSPVHWAWVAGQKPDGLELSEDGVLAGAVAPEVPVGTYTLTARAWSSTGSAEREFSLRVDAGP